MKDVGVKYKNVQVRVGNNVTILAGFNVTLKCVTEGFPPPKVSWFKFGNESSNRGSTYHIANTSKSDEGRYTCSAKNVFGTDDKSSYVTVIGK